MPPIKSKDAKKVLEYDILTYTKGFIAQSTIDGSIVKEYFQFREIHQVIHHPRFRAHRAHTVHRVFHHLHRFPHYLL